MNSSPNQARAKPVYSIDAPDQARLKVARLEIEAVLARHDLAGVVVLHTPGMSEFFYNLRPSYSVCWIDEAAGAVRLKSKRDRDHAGDAAVQVHDQTATANMTEALLDNLFRATLMFGEVNQVVSTALRATHTPGMFVPDPAEGKRQ